MQYLKNSDLSDLVFDWRGNPFDGKRFVDPNHDFKPSFSEILKWKVGGNDQREEKKNDTWKAKVHQFKFKVSESDDYIVWLGHASFFIQMNGTRLMIDPVFYDLPFLKRITPLPFDPGHLPKIDYLLLSHDHRDHCDKQSIKTIFEQHQPKVLTGLKMTKLLKKWVRNSAIQEAGWFQVYSKGKHDHDIEVIYLPARHWSRRGLNDFNKRLWGSFIIRTPGRTIYLGADSALGNHFQQIGGLFPNIQLAVLGIGAYKPPEIMKKVHTSPTEAYQAFKDLGAKQFFPMHYGTFDLSDEPMVEPYQEIQRIFEERGEREMLVLGEIGEQKFLANSPS